jgi:hypothetical protein
LKYSAENFGLGENFQQQNSAIVMNVVVTSHQLVCLYSPTGEEGEPPRHTYWLIGVPASAVDILFIFNNKFREGVFWTFGIPKPSYCLQIELVMKKRSSTMKGYCWGSSSPLKVLKTKTIGKVILNTFFFSAEAP